MIDYMQLEDLINNSDNKEFVLKAVKENGKFLEYASNDLKNDKEVVKTALEQDAEALEFAGDKLKNDKDIILLGVKRSTLDNLLCFRKVKSK